MPPQAQLTRTDPPGQEKARLSPEPDRNATRDALELEGSSLHREKLRFPMGGAPPSLEEK